MQVPVTLDQIKAGDHRAIRTAFDKLYEHRYSHHSPDEPVEMVNIRLAVIGQRPRLKFPSVARNAAAKASRQRPVWLSDSANAVTSVRCTIARALGGGTKIRWPRDHAGTRHHDGAVRGRQMHVSCRRANS